MNSKKNKIATSFLALIILASCSVTSNNLQKNLARSQVAIEDKDFQEIYSYQSYFVNDLEIIQQAIENGNLNQDQLREAKLVKKNYQKILNKDKFFIKLNPNQKYSLELIRLIYQSNLPINISWVNTEKNPFPENLLSNKINGFCSSLYDESILSINNEINKNNDSTLVIYSEEYESFLQALKLNNSNLAKLKYNSTNFQEFSSKALGISSSEERFKKISSLNPNQNLKFKPRSRSDFQQIVLFVKPQEYRAMIPALRYHGGNKFKYINFVSSLEEINNPLQLLDYEDSFANISVLLSDKIKKDSSISLDNFLELGILNDWLLIQILKQSGVQSAKINSTTGTIFYKSNSCVIREIPLKEISADLFSS
tara:strand:+ start:1111 stop:2214 length:1104 start_codon:yes stop_codon:yes gene_type:complete